MGTIACEECGKEMEEKEGYWNWDWKSSLCEKCFLALRAARERVSREMENPPKE